MIGEVIFEFSSYSEYLKFVGNQHLSRRNRPVTLQQWSKKLGYRSPRSIAMVLKGQRVPSQDMVNRLSRQLDHSERQHRYFELLIELEKKKRKGADVTETLAGLKKINPKVLKRIPLDIHALTYISEWYHLAIKQLISTPCFREDSEWIKKQLRNKVNSSEISSAIQRMLEMGILARSAQGKLEVVEKNLKTPVDVPSTALSHHHRQMMIRATEALKEQNVLQREITSLTLRCDGNRIAEIKKTIRKFKDEFETEFDCETSNKVFQLNIQFFQHTLTEDDPKPISPRHLF